MLPILLPFIANLVSTDVELGCPWTFQGSVPDGVRGKKNKAARSEWIESPATEHMCYSGWEGIADNARISKGGEDGNPPYRLMAIVADYDAAHTEHELELGCKRVGEYLPAYYEKTLSGYSRFVWTLEEPVTVPSRDFAVALLKHLKRRLAVDSLAVGLDEPAWLAPERYYTNSGDWSKVSDYKIPKALMAGWVFEVAERFSFRSVSSIKIPMEIVWPELQKKFPSATWPSDFEAGSQGPSFWIEGSQSPKSALLKDEGLFTFAAHATKPFWSWRDLLGTQFVEGYETKSLGEAVDGIYFDGKGYWRKDGPGKWRPFSKEDTVIHLKVTRGLSDAAPKGASSDTERALEHVRQWAGIVGAAPFVFRPTGLTKVMGNVSVLNTFTRTTIRPAEAPVIWGPTGPMPFLSDYIGTLFDPHEQLDFFLSWTKRFYETAYELKLQSGQNLFIIGSTGVGKTLLSTQVLAKLVGGNATAENYLLGKTDFNSQLFESALWTVDDTSSSNDVASHRRFSTIIKRMAANTTFEFHAKFQVPCQVRWQGRVVVTANADEESIRVIPDLDISILDKIIILKTTDACRAFPPQAQLEATIDSELPHFARYLLDYVVPAQCGGDSRYGIRSYHEKSLVAVAKHASTSNNFTEILEDWRNDYFAEHSDDWVGTSHQFFVELHRDMARAAALRGLTGNIVNRQLSALKNKGHIVQCRENGSHREWIIPPPLKAPPKSVPQSQTSNFQK